MLFRSIKGKFLIHVDVSDLKGVKMTSFYDKFVICMSESVRIFTAFRSNLEMCPHLVQECSDFS